MKKLTFFTLLLSFFTFSDVPVEDFYKFDEFFDISISPEGGYFAAKQRLVGEKRNGLVIINRKTMKPVNIIYFDENWYVNDYYWLSEERIAIRKGKHFGGLKAPYSTGFFWAVNIDGSNISRVIDVPNVVVVSVNEFVDEIIFYPNLTWETYSLSALKEMDSFQIMRQG